MNYIVVGRHSTNVISLAKAIYEHLAFRLPVAKALCKRKETYGAWSCVCQSYIKAFGVCDP